MVELDRLPTREIPVIDWRRVLVDLIVQNPSTVDVIVSGSQDATPSITDARTRELSRLGALCGTGASPASYASVVQRALDAGATPDQLVGTLIDVGPLIGTARLAAAALGVAPALEFDVDAELESLDDSRS